MKLEKLVFVNTFCKFFGFLHFTHYIQRIYLSEIDLKSHILQKISIQKLLSRLRTAPIRYVFQQMLANSTAFQFSNIILFCCLLCIFVRKYFKIQLWYTWFIQDVKRDFHLLTSCSCLFFVQLLCNRDESFCIYYLSVRIETKADSLREKWFWFFFSTAVFRLLQKAFTAEIDVGLSRHPNHG